MGHFRQSRDARSGADKISDIAHSCKKRTQKEAEKNDQKNA